MFYFSIVHCERYFYYSIVCFGATQSSVFVALSKRFSGTSGELDCPIDVKIAYDRTVRVVRGHRDCTLQLFSE